MLHALHSKISQPDSLAPGDVAFYSDIFEVYADATSDGQPCMTPAAFSKAIAPASVAHRLDVVGKEVYSRYQSLFPIADVDGRGLLTKDDFVRFLSLVHQSDSVPSLVFHAIGGPAANTVDAAPLASLIGPDKSSAHYLKDQQQLPYAEFVQLLESAHFAHASQAFSVADTQKTGTIPATSLFDLVSKFAPLEPSGLIARHLPLLTQSSDHQVVGYPTFLALISLLSDPSRIRNAANLAASHQQEISKRKAIPDTFQLTKEAFAKGTASLLTPLEVSILFRLAGGPDAATAVDMGSINLLLEECHRSFCPAMPSTAQTTASTAAPDLPKSRSALREIMFQMYNFAIGAVAGGIGAAVVYPIDLVKTRMQNQRAAVVGEMMYKNSMDCFRKVIRNEGILGLYRGLGPQLVGVAPEKAIKLTVNDFVRARLTSKETGKIAFASEIFAGAMAGASQVVFTNPLEIVKIRLQVQGEMLKDATVNGAPIVRRGAVTIVKELGLLGLYKGASACLLRDVPFSAIYFSCYSHLKTDLFHEGERQLGILDLLLAGAIAGMPAAYLTTPADVIKTRLQVVAKKGETVYRGLFDAARKIYHEEGFRAFFKGGPARIFRSSPQFGTTLMCYELIHRFVPFPGEKHESSADRVNQQTRDLTAYTRLFQTGNALRMLHDANYKFGSYQKAIATIPEKST